MAALQGSPKTSLSIQAVDMIAVAMILAGALIAVALDWSIYTNLSAYIRAGFRLNRYVRFRDLLFTKWQKGRFFLVIISGATAGFSFSESNPSLWISALIVFTLAHSLIYLFLFERR